MFSLSVLTSLSSELIVKPSFLEIKSFSHLKDVLFTATLALSSSLYKPRGIGTPISIKFSRSDKISSNEKYNI